MPCFIALRRYARSRLSPAGVVSDTAIANGNTAHWANDRVGVTPSTATALSASESNSATVNGVLAGQIHFRHNGEIAAKFGWHAAALYA
jgi:hypothetical protein